MFFVLKIIHKFVHLLDHFLSKKVPEGSFFSVSFQSGAGKTLIGTKITCVETQQKTRKKLLRNVQRRDIHVVYISKYCSGNLKIERTFLHCLHDGSAYFRFSFMSMVMHSTCKIILEHEN